MSPSEFPEGTIILQSTLSSQEPRQLHLHALDASCNTLLDVTLNSEQAFQLLVGGQVKTMNLAGTDVPFAEAG